MIALQSINDIVSYTTCRWRFSRNKFGKTWGKLKTSGQLPQQMSRLNNEFSKYTRRKSEVRGRLAAFLFRFTRRMR